MKFSDDNLFDDDTFEINITPLIDVVFLLLIFFMVSTTFDSNSGIDLELPSAETSTPDKKNKPLTVSITKDGRYFVDEKPKTLEQLRTQFVDAYKNDPDSTIILRADENTTHQKVVAVMDLARKAGISDLAIAAKR